MIHEALKQILVHKFKTWMFEYCEQEHVIQVENMYTSCKILLSARFNHKGFLFLYATNWHVALIHVNKNLKQHVCSSEHLSQLKVNNQ